MNGRDPTNPDDLAPSDFIGKYVLVGITRQEEEDSEPACEQFHGRVIAVEPTEGIILRLEGSRAGDEYTLPPDPSAFSPAPPGDYHLRSGGEVVSNPDFLATWTVVSGEDDA